jgi:hypothetical protein
MLVPLSSAAVAGTLTTSATAAVEISLNNAPPGLHQRAQQESTLVCRAQRVCTLHHIDGFVPEPCRLCVV